MLTHVLRRLPAAGCLAVACLGAQVPAHAAAAPVTCQGRTATVVGTAGRDHLTGTDGVDVIAGLAGNDRIDALDGDDLVCGGPGSDHLIGGPGDDRLLGATDRKLGKGGSASLTGDLLDGGPGDDLLDAGRDPRAGRISYFRYDRVTFAAAPAGVALDLSTSPGTALGDGSDTVVEATDLAVVGSPYDDRLRGSALAETIVGGAGDDMIEGEAGRDSLYPDTRHGGSGDDVVHGGPGDDFIASNAGHDELDGEAGGDLLRASSGRASSVDGGPGDDQVEQAITPDGGLASSGGPGRDQVYLGWQVLAPGPRGDFSLDLRDGSATLASAPDAVGHVDGYEDITLGGRLSFTFHGTPGADRVRVVRAPLRAWTYGGNDLLSGARLDDLLDAGPGRDEVHGGGGDDVCRHWETGRC